MLTATSARALRSGADWTRIVRAPEAGLVVAIAVATAIFTAANPDFLAVETAQNVLRAAAFAGIVVVGQTLLLISGEFDLSVGSTTGFGAIVAASLTTFHGWPWPIAALTALVAGGLIGLVNGTLVARVGIPALVVTLGMLYAVRGLTLVISDGLPINPLPKPVDNFGRDSLLGLPWAVWLFLLLVIVAELVLRWTTFGRRLYAAGGNRRAATFAGLRPTQAKIVAFVIVGALAAFAGMLLASRLGSADPTFGQGTELTIIAGAVVGGVSLFGGSGSVIGAFLGIVFLQVVSSGIVVAGLRPTLQPVAVGVLLVLAVALDGWRRRRLTSS